ncbi:hypothetical protein ANN_22504 [Periplaneta americana]|uniref:Uncharacterized protein n=1 Tax=Periplaneta americana TaxID=6978 RepID=A0ABQ8S8N1_PERAM|nr:hypothetical protein ANN_22504 [Periplaneta americana]
MSSGSSTESYSAFAHIGLRENSGKNLNQGVKEVVDRNIGSRNIEERANMNEPSDNSQNLKNFKINIEENSEKIQVVRKVCYDKFKLDVRAEDNEETYRTGKGCNRPILEGWGEERRGEERRGEERRGEERRGEGGEGKGREERRGEERRGEERRGEERRGEERRGEERMHYDEKESATSKAMAMYQSETRQKQEMKNKVKCVLRSTLNKKKTYKKSGLSTTCVMKFSDKSENSSDSGSEYEEQYVTSKLACQPWLSQYGFGFHSEVLILVDDDGEKEEEKKRGRGSGKEEKEVEKEKHTRTHLYKTLARSVLCYGSKAWTLRKSDEKRITASEMKFKCQQQDTLNGIIKEMKTSYKNCTAVGYILQYQDNRLHHVKCIPRTSILQVILNYKPTGKRSLSRPVKRWWENFCRPEQPSRKMLGR